MQDRNGRRVTRVELHDRVWRTPVRRLAAEYGITDVALAKVCRKLGVPRPPRGYWRKVECGMKIKKPALPRRSPEAPSAATIRGAVGMSVKSQIEDCEIVFPEGAFIVRQGPGRYHMEVSRTRVGLMEGYMDKGRVRSGRGLINVEVSKPLIPRAMRILDAVVRGVEALGWVLERPKPEQSLRIRVGESLVEFHLIEGLRRVAATPTSFGSKWDLVPNGRLSLIVGDRRWKRSVIRDTGIKRKVEDGLRDFARALLAASRQMVQERIAEEAREEEEAARRARVEAIERRLNARDDCMQRLENATQAWRTCQDMLRFLDACEAQLAAHEVDVKGEAPSAQWLRWAKQAVKDRDPLNANFALHEHINDFAVGELLPSEARVREMQRDDVGWNIAHLREWYDHAGHGGPFWKDWRRWR